MLANFPTSVTQSGLLPLLGTSRDSYHSHLLAVLLKMLFTFAVLFACHFNAIFLPPLPSSLGDRLICIDLYVYNSTEQFSVKVPGEGPPEGLPWKPPSLCQSTAWLHQPCKQQRPSSSIRDGFNEPSPTLKSQSLSFLTLLL